MDVRNCKQCGCLYNYVGGSYKNLCPGCIRRIESKFETVKEYIQDNVSATISDVSAECGVSVRQIEQWVREERLCFADDSPIGIACEVCGATIKTGRYCDNCRNTVLNELGSIYKPEQRINRRKDSTARMRFLDK